MPDAVPLPAVLAVVVATDGAMTLPRTLAALAAQTYEDLTVIGVDNASSDSSRTLLQDALGGRHVFVAERDLGFGGAVGLALDADVARGPELILMVHDDLELRPDAVQQLVATMMADDDLAVVGCKLVEWADSRRLQAVGMSVDLTGRADPGVEEDEVDQGQRDHESRTLYVSTAGMLVRRDRFEALGRFDHRYHLFRDDLDLCWRAWLWGWSVAVVPDAVASHEASASTYRRLGQTALLGPRYFAERNTLATLIKCYGLGRLLLVLPLFLLVGILKTIGFLATRRVGDAWQTVRAWGWNIVHLRESRRLRRVVQAGRTRPDKEIAPMFAQVTTRLRAYGEAFGELLAGGTNVIDIGEPTGPPAPVVGLAERLRTRLRTSPVGVAGAILFVLGAVVSLPLLRTTTLTGGELARWPSGAWEMLVSYARPWAVGDLPAVTSVTPAQALLAIPSAIGLGVAWAAPRILLLSVVPLAWMSALRAGRLVTLRRLPRVAGATLYALSPPVLAALRTGRIGPAVAAALAPLVVIAAGRAVLPDVPVDRAWRAAAAGALAGATVVAFAPGTALLALVAAAAVAIGLAVSSPPDMVPRLSRLGVMILGAALLLAPWMPAVAGTGGVAEVAGDAKLWRMLLLTPDMPGFSSPIAGIGLAAASLLGVALAAIARRGVSIGLVVVYLASVTLAWLIARTGAAAPVWPGAPLAIAALAAAGLLTIAIASAESELGAHDFGWRQMASIGTVVVVCVGVVAAGMSIANQTWEGYTEDDGPLPAYLASEVDAAGIGPFRVLVLGESDGLLRWSITDADGPSAASWGHAVAADVMALLDVRVAAVVGGRDPGASADLGRLGIRYIVVPEDVGSDSLSAVLAGQLDLVAQPVARGAVLRVTTWMPRWSVVPEEGIASLASGRPLPAGMAVTPLADHTQGAPGVLVLADLVSSDEAPFRIKAVDGDELSPRRVGDLVAWTLPASAVEISRRSTTPRSVLVTLQGLLVLLAISLSLRAPRFAREVKR
ncbi:MAG: GT2 family glycosyltransferase [Nitriliruptoraceae bacterium]